MKKLKYYRVGKYTFWCSSRTLAESVVEDLVTFSCLLATMYINYNYLGNSLIAVILLSLWILAFFTKSQREGMTKEAFIRSINNDGRD